MDTQVGHPVLSWDGRGRPHSDHFYNILFLNIDLFRLYPNLTKYLKISNKRLTSLIETHHISQALTAFVEKLTRAMDKCRSRLVSLLI